jgi:hypothetical protein
MSIGDRQATGLSTYELGVSPSIAVPHYGSSMAPGSRGLGVTRVAARDDLPAIQSTAPPRTLQRRIRS